MGKILSFKSKVDNPPALHDRAMDNLEFIRNTMESSSTFTAVSGWGMVVVGLIAIGTALFASLQPTSERWLLTWLVAGALALVIQLWALILKSRRSGIPLFSGPGRKFILAVSPTIFAGAVLTLVLHRAEMVEIIPAMWLLLYGASVAAGGANSIELVPLMGFCFLLSGSIALITPISWNDWILGFAFGGLHILFGIPIARGYGG